MSQPIRTVVIVGGGTSGWMTAAYLTKALQETVKVTLIESATIKKIGVGEATVPNLQRVFFDFLGLSEEEWMPQVNGSFKLGIRYIDWAHNPSPGTHEHFYHFFGGIPTCEGIPLQQYWLRKVKAGYKVSMDYSCSLLSKIENLENANRSLFGVPGVKKSWQ